MVRGKKSCKYLWLPGSSNIIEVDVDTYKLLERVIDGFREDQSGAELSVGIRSPYEIDFKTVGNQLKTIGPRRVPYDYF